MTNFIRIVARSVTLGFLLSLPGYCALAGESKTKKESLPLQWSYDASRVFKDDRNDFPESLVLTGHTILIQSWRRTSTIAVDRAQGPERWHNSHGRSELRSCSSGDLCAVQAVEPGAETPSIQVIDALTAKSIWSLPDTILHYGGSGIVIVEKREGGVRFIEARTGTEIEPTTASGQEILRSTHALSKRAPSAIAALLQFPLSVARIDLLTGEVTRLRGGGIENVWIGDRLVSRIDTDNDAPGGSLFPKYLKAYDRSGKEVWQFPREIHTRDDVFGLPDSMVENMWAIPDAKVIVARDDGYPGITGIRASDGKILWRKSLPGYSIRQVLPEEGGFWLMGSPSGATKCSTVAYIEGQTGQFHWRARLPKSSAFAIDRKQLFALGEDGMLRAYDAPASRTQDKTARLVN